MSNNGKKIVIVGVIFLIVALATTFIVIYNLYSFLIVMVPLDVMFFIWFIYLIFNVNASDESTYNKTLSKITRVHDPVLVNTNTFPKLNNKSILTVGNFDDLIDAQAETRKPIYFVIGKESTAFYLISDDVFLIYFLKVNNDKECDLEIELKKVELQSSLNLDAIKDFDRTVVVNANNKSYKVSPIRDENKNTTSKNTSITFPSKDEELKMNNDVARNKNNNNNVKISIDKNNKISFGSLSSNISKN